MHAQPDDTRRSIHADLGSRVEPEADNCVTARLSTEAPRERCTTALEPAAGRGEWDATATRIPTMLASLGRPGERPVPKRRCPPPRCPEPLVTNERGARLLNRLAGITLPDGRISRNGPGPCGAGRQHRKRCLRRDRRGVAANPT